MIRFSRFRAAPWILLFASGWLTPAASRAQTSYWNATSGTFSEAGNWIGGVPDATQVAIWTNNNGSSITISFSADATNAGASFNSLSPSTGASGSRILDIGANTWWATNQFHVGTVPGLTGSVQTTTGNLVVTNSEGTAQILVGGTGVGTLTLNGGVTIADQLVATNADRKNLVLNSGVLTLLHGSTLSMGSNGTFNLGATAGQEMTLQVLGGTNVTTFFGSSKYLSIGAAANATGTVVVAGNGTIWSNVIGDSSRVDLHVGGHSAGGGHLVVSNGASVYSQGNLKMLGTNGLLLVADGGRFSAERDNGGSVTGVGNLLIVSNPTSSVSLHLQFIGQNSASNQWIIADGGQITVTAANSSVHLGGGSNGVGNAILIYGDGSRLSLSGALSIDVGAGFGGAISAAGPGRSNYVVVASGGSLVGGAVSDLVVGRYGDGARLWVTNGGSVTARYLNVGLATNTASGQVLVDGAESLLRVSSLSVGTNNYNPGPGANRGRGLVLAQNGGVIEAINLYGGMGGVGIVSNLGGVFQFAVANPGISNYGQATLVVQNGTVAFRHVVDAQVLGAITNLTYAGANTLRLIAATNALLTDYAFSNGAAFASLDLQSNSLFRSTNSLFLGVGGRLTGNGVLASRIVTSAGAISPGNSPGALVFSNDLTLLDASTLVLEIAGTNSGQYDFLDIKGALTMNGNVLVTNLGYSFVGGESFNFLDAGAWSGAFDGWTLPMLTGGMTWDTSLFETAGILSVVPVPEPATWIALAAGIVLLSLRRRPAA